MSEENKNFGGEPVAELAVKKESVSVKNALKPVYAQFLLPGAILIAAIMVSATLMYTRGESNSGIAQLGGGNNQPPAKVDVKVEPQNHILGSNDAKVTIVEFSDFQCPFCRSFWSDAFAQIKKDYVDTGKVRFVFRHFPLDFHAGAKPAAEGSECAAEQGKFWEMHDRIFEEQAKKGQGTIQFTKQDVAKWAGAIGLNMAQFNQCINSSKYTKLVEDDAAYGASLGVSGTPTSFINGQRVVGAQPYASFKAVIDALLEK